MSAVAVQATIAVAAGDETANGKSAGAAANDEPRKNTRPTWLQVPVDVERQDGEEAEGRAHASAEGRLTSGRIISAVEQFQSLPACRRCTRRFRQGCNKFQ